jgi:hypothetical protein
MGKPLLISADPESALSTVVSNAGCGLVSAPDTSDLLLRNLLSLYKDPTLCQTLGQNGRQHVKAYDRERVLSSFMRRILEGN